MPTAYVLINCELSRKTEVIRELSQLAGLLEVSEVHGAYDILVKLNQASVDELKETIKWHLKKISDIKSTVTLIAIEGADRGTS